MITRFAILLLLPIGSIHGTSPVEQLIEASCIECHDAETKTKLNFESLGYDLSDADTFRMWERVYDRVQSGEMPPKKKPRPDATPVSV